jgi:hypothetical protein
MSKQASTHKLLCYSEHFDVTPIQFANFHESTHDPFKHSKVTLLDPTLSSLGNAGPSFRLR